MAKAPHDLRLRLVFSGKTLPGHDPQAVRQAVAAALKLSHKNTERLFSGKHIVLKQQVDAAYAARQITRFAKMGAVLRTEPMSRNLAATAPTAPPALPRIQSLLAKLPKLPKLAQLPSLRKLRELPRLAARPALVALGLLAGVLVLAGAWLASQGNDPADPAARMAQAQPDARTPIKPIASQAQAVVNIAPPEPGSLADEDLPRPLSPQAAREYRQQYWPAAWHKAFAVASSGAHAWVIGADSEKQARQVALARCAQVQPTGGNTCRVVDVDGEPQN